MTPFSSPSRSPLSSLDRKDRRLLLVILSLVGALVLVLAVFTPAGDPDNNPVPDSYLAGRHGAKAAFTVLQQSGYWIERWQQSLSELAEHAGPNTTVIVASPHAPAREDREAIASILNKGGRVIATDFFGGALLPQNEVTVSTQASFAACEAKPEGLQPLAAAGSVWIAPRAAWNLNDPKFRAAYTCGNQPVVVEYPAGKGTAIWWASSTPLENASIVRGQNLELLLNSIGPPQGNHVYWDESMHSAPPSSLDYVSGPVWPLLFFGSLGIFILVVLSFSRRRGPVRPLPHPHRSSPIEFLDALGSLYRSTGAASTVLQIAWDRFRTQAARLTGLSASTGSNIQTAAGIPAPGKANSQLVTGQLGAAQLADAIQRRFGTTVTAGQTMRTDLIEAEEACRDDSLKPRRALALVQTLQRHEEALRRACSHSRAIA